MRKTFAILLAMLLALALLICACEKDPNGDPADTYNIVIPEDTEADIEPEETEPVESESQSETDTLPPVVNLGTQPRPQQTVAGNDETDPSVDFDSSQMVPNEDESQTRDEGYWDGEFEGAAPDQH